LFGASGGAVSYGNSAGAPGLLFAAQSGNETLNASASNSNNLIYAGADSTGHNVLDAGHGNDTLVAGTGADTLGGGSGSDLFVFIAGHAGGTDVISGFTSQDLVELAGSSIVALKTQTNPGVSGVNTTVTLSDNTTIIFLGVTDPNALTGHIVST